MLAKRTAAKVRTRPRVRDLSLVELALRLALRDRPLRADGDTLPLSCQEGQGGQGPSVNPFHPKAQESLLGFSGTKCLLPLSPLVESSDGNEPIFFELEPNSSLETSSSSFY